MKINCNKWTKIEIKSEDAGSVTEVERERDVIASPYFAGENRGANPSASLS